MIKYQDVTLGKIVSEIKTKNGEITSMCQNPYNAVICTGHSNGTVNMWTPNYGSDPVVKILSHPFSVNTMSIDPTGKYLVTTGSDSKMKVWDLRNSYKELYEYFNPLIATSTTISQRGLLAVSQGSVVEIWKDYYKEKQKEPYMKHHYKNNQTQTKSMKFVNFEDFLGIGTNFGYSSIAVPGSGESNFDTFENNPYETKNQRKNKEIKHILEKIPYDMISLDPNHINKVDPRSKSVIDKERKEETKKKAEELVKNQKKKMKQRLKNKERHELILKEFNKNQAVRNKLRAMIEIQTDKKNKEKEKVKSDVKVLKMLQDDFDPEVYIQKKEDNSDEGEYNDEDVDNHIE